MRRPYRPPVTAVAPVASTGMPSFNLAGIATPNALQSVGFTLNLIFVFFVFSRMPELIGERTGLNVPMVMLLALLGTPAALISGNPSRLMKMAPVRLLLAFTVWLIIAAPFSQWRTGTLDLFKGIWIKTILICVVIAIVVENLQQVRKMLYALAYATMFIIATILLWGGSSFGRLTFGEGSLSNPNEIASRLLTGFCFCLFVVWTENGLTIKKVLTVVAIPFLLLLALRTGSRAGLLTMVALFILLLLRASPGKKIVMVAGSCILTLLLLLFLPQETKSRYATMFSSRQSMYDDRVSTEDKMAIGSTEARTELLQEGLSITAHHPIFGVGAGVYVEAAGGFAEKAGRRAIWHETHNTYLQLAAELGIPGFLLYVSALFICCKRTFALYRKTRPYPDLKMVMNMSYCLFLALVSWAIGAFFDSRAYLMEFPILLALTSAFVLSADAKVAEYLAAFPSPGAAVPSGQFGMRDRFAGPFTPRPPAPGKEPGSSMTGPGVAARLPYGPYPNRSSRS